MRWTGTLTALKGTDMAWETPSYSDVRFGFEVTMYINNR
ncbi:MAG: pyrroloquinoline quinone precursor peptide PqqA [Gammaproteobacteria bacterium]